VGAKLRETSNAKDTRTLLLGLPDNVKGAICFRNAGSFFLGRNPEFADRAIEVPPQDGGFFTRILWYDPKTGACQDYIDSWGAALPLTPEGWTADFRGGRRQVDEAHFTSAHVSSVKDGAAWTVWPESFIGNVHLPPLRVSGIRRVRVELDADCLRQDESRSECRLFVTTFQHAFQRRREYSLPAEIDLPATAELLSIDLRIPFGSRLVLRRVTVKPF
jgi:hypothetical protein